MPAQSSLLRLGFCLLLVAQPLLAAEPPSDGKRPTSKEAELLQLRGEVQRQKAEIERLRHENEALRGQPAPAPAQPVAAQPSPAPIPPAGAIPAAAVAVSAQPTAAPQPRIEPTRPLASIEAPGPEDVFSATDLAAYFLADPAAAEARFAGRSFRVRGIATGFESRPFQHSCWVELRTPDPAIRIRVAVEFAMDGPPIVPAQNGNKLVIRGPNGNRELLARGAEAVLRGRCRGSRNGSVEFTSGSLVSRP